MCKLQVKDVKKSVLDLIETEAAWDEFRAGLPESSKGKPAMLVAAANDHDFAHAVDARTLSGYSLDEAERWLLQLAEWPARRQAALAGSPW